MKIKAGDRVRIDGKRDMVTVEEVFHDGSLTVVRYDGSTFATTLDRVTAVHARHDVAEWVEVLERADYELEQGNNMVARSLILGLIILMETQVVE